MVSSFEAAKSRTVGNLEDKGSLIRVAPGIRNALLHPSVIIGNHSFHSGLLEHYFGDPYLDRPVLSVCWSASPSTAGTDLVRALAPRFRAQRWVEWFPPGHAPRVVDRGKPHCQRTVDQFGPLLCQCMPSDGVASCGTGGRRNIEPCRVLHQRL